MYLSNEDYDFIYSRVPRICVDLAIIHDGKILLTKRDIEPYQHHWHLPGGRVDFRETVTDALARIARNELDVIIDKAELIGAIEFLEEEQGGSLRHSISLLHRVSITGVPRDGDWFATLPFLMIRMQEDAIAKYGLL